jgi:transposase
MALVLAVALSLLIVEADMPIRKPSVVSPIATADRSLRTLLNTLHPHAAGIDVGSAEHLVCVPEGSLPVPPDAPAGLLAHVRSFGAFTCDLRAIVAWLRSAQVDTVAMQATGVYWIPLYDLLQAEGFAVLLVDPRQTTRAPNRPKTDVHECQWIQRLHSLGLLAAAFRPEEPIRVWRSYQRHRQSLVEDGSRHIQRMQKALEQMNVKLTEVLSDITGTTGLAIIKAILAGQHQPKKLAELRDRRCRESQDTIAKSLEGTWQPEHLFALKQSLTIYEHYQQQIAECDRALEEHLKTLALPEKPPALKPKVGKRRRRGNEPHFDARQRLHEMAGVDLTAIEGIEAGTALVLLSEIGTDMSPWPSVKHFGAWLGLSPNPKKSGGKMLSSKTGPGKNRAAKALRLAARSLHRSQSALGAFFRRIAARRGVPKAITATAHRLARIVYAMLKDGEEYAAQKMEDYEAAYKERQLRNLKRMAAERGYTLTPMQQEGEVLQPN